MFYEYYGEEKKGSSTLAQMMFFSGTMKFFLFALLVTAVVSVDPDQNNNCEGWALSGECDNNPGYMLTNCATLCKNVAAQALVEAEELKGIKSFFNLSASDIHGKMINFKSFKGQVFVCLLLSLSASCASVDTPILIIASWSNFGASLRTLSWSTFWHSRVINSVNKNQVQTTRFMTLPCRTVLTLQWWTRLMSMEPMPVSCTNIWNQREALVAFCGTSWRFAFYEASWPRGVSLDWTWSSSCLFLSTFCAVSCQSYTATDGIRLPCFRNSWRSVSFAVSLLTSLNQQWTPTPLYHSTSFLQTTTNHSHTTQLFSCSIFFPDTLIQVVKLDSCTYEGNERTVSECMLDGNIMLMTRFTCDYSKPFHIYCDARDVQLGAAIIQDGKPVAFYSCMLTKHQLNYTIGEKEHISVVETLKEFCTMLYGCPDIHVYTDHRNNTFQRLSSQSVL